MPDFKAWMGTSLNELCKEQESLKAGSLKSGKGKALSSHFFCGCRVCSVGGLDLMRALKNRRVKE